MEGIREAKRKGKYTGRKPTARAKSDQIFNLLKEGKTKQKIADELGIGIASVYRIISESKNSPKTNLTFSAAGHS